MPNSLIQPRRVAAVLLVLSVAIALASCSRKDKILDPVVTGPVTWTNTIHHLISDRSQGETPTGCTSCHHAGTTLPNWSEYTVVRDYNLAYPGTMPYYIDNAMGQFLQPGEAQIIKDWIAAGMLE